MASASVQKGHDLERAVKFIQETILASDPELKGTKFSIEGNKIVTVSGVRHEIDVWVKTLPGSRYESTWIFECKNWKKPVSKNDVIILTGKVNALAANRGFLVARRFSKDAEAQAKLDPRLKLIECTDEFASPLRSIELIHSVCDLLPMHVNMKQRGVAPRKDPTTLDLKGKICRLNGTPVDFNLFMDKRIRELLSQDKNENAAQYEHEGAHWGRRSEQILFEPGEFLIGEMDVEYMVLDIKYTLTLRKQKLISKFELKGQGRAFSFEAIDSVIPGTRLEVDVVQLI